MIRLESISIKNFRGIREGEVKGFADVNIFIGRNNSGKSTIGEAIVRALTPFGPAQDPLGRRTADEWIKSRNGIGLPAPEGWYKLDQTKPVLLSAEVSGFPSLVKIIMQRGNLTEIPEITRMPIPPELELVQDFARRLSAFRPQDALNQSVETTLWPRIIAHRRDKAMTKALNSIFGIAVEQIQILPNNRLMVLYSDYGLPIDVQGDGARSAVRCLMILAELRGTLFILEEPECHQHPGSLEKFARALCEQAKEQEVQLLISTHSAECVSAFVKAAKGIPSESAIFHLKLDEGNLSATRLSPESFETLESTGVDVRFLELYA